MPDLPLTHAPPVIRADFTNDEVWDQIKRDVERPTADGFQAWAAFSEDRELDGLGEAALVARMPHDFPHGYQHPVVFVADGVTIANVERPLLVISTDEQATWFRCLPSTVQAIQNNLSLANMDFVDFADAVDADGVFRGF